MSSKQLGGLVSSLPLNFVKTDLSRIAETYEKSGLLAESFDLRFPQDSSRN